MFFLHVRAVCVQKNCTHNMRAVLGSSVNFNCTLDVNLSAHRVRWVHRSPSNYLVGHHTWYNGGKYDPSVESRGVSVEDNPTRGWSVLTIPRVRLEDHGIFKCFVVDLQEVNFQLSVTGKNYIIYCNIIY